VLAALILVAAVANLNLSVANVALPSIVQHFDSSQTTQRPPDRRNQPPLDHALGVMTVVALIVTPILLLYGRWTYYVFRHRLGGDEHAVDAVELVARKTGV
jgi:hypothetical protein